MSESKYMVYWTMTNGAPNSMEIGSLTTALSYAELHRRQEEKDQWKAEWDCFAVEHPDIMSLLPIRG